MAAPVAEAVCGDGQRRAGEVDGGGGGGRDVRPTRRASGGRDVRPTGPRGAAFDGELVAVAGEGEAVVVGEVAEDDGASEADLACGLVFVADDAFEPGERGGAEVGRVCAHAASVAGERAGTSGGAWRDAQSRAKVAVRREKLMS
ncbi:MAG: hypothetical protein ACKVS8_05230 [Phycisphaerales bacterium]